MNPDLKFVCVGATKCGTTWLSSVLRGHPEINVSLNKEPCYFSVHYGRGPQWYASIWKDQPGLKGEFTNYYMFSKKALDRLKNDYPDVRIIVLLREPIARSISHYKMVRRTRDFKNFQSISEESPAIFNRSFYYEALKSVYDIFPAENIFVGFYDEIQNDPADFLKQVCRFLKVDDNYLPKNLNRQFGKGFIPKFRKLDKIRQGVHDFLIEKQMYRTVLWIKKTGLPDKFKSLIAQKATKDEIPMSVFESYRGAFLEDLSKLKNADFISNKSYIKGWEQKLSQSIEGKQKKAS
ncbi:MAG: sulfotransferase [Deltaproteobacteria bacterium]|nr:sulfotransferase [Deltaproteobacteria bacterium]